MHLPYTNKFPEAVAIAGQVSGVALSAVLWSRPLRSRAQSIAFGVAIWIVALLPTLIPDLAEWSPNSQIFPLLQASALLSAYAIVKTHRSRWLRALAVFGELALLALTLYVQESDYELAFAHLFWLGVLLGAHLFWVAPPAPDWAERGSRSQPNFARHDLIIFFVTVGVAFTVTNLIFGRLVYNGDEVANSYQADVYGHFRAYGPVPPCPSMFENYWVFRHDGRAFSQYTPGWPLFMALFSRLGVISLAGPVMAGILAVGIARLSRRLSFGLGSNLERSEQIVGVAGFAGALFAMLGPSMLLNGASRFSHPMVCACFAWGVESSCVVSDRTVTPARAWAYGIALGSAAALGVATRPADGGTLGVGIFLYFAWSLARRRVGWRAFVGTAIGFCAFAGLTLILLRLQLGEWFQTGYTIAPSIHPEAALRLSVPAANQIKYSLPLATGSYCWWPAAPALGVAGLIRALGGRERRVSFMLVSSAAVFLGFYFFVEFGRGGDDGLGPRYILPTVVLMASGGAAVIAPLVASTPVRSLALPVTWLSAAVPMVLAALAVVYGAIAIAPLIYPVAEHEYTYDTAPLRGAAAAKLKNAIVIIEQGHSTADDWNLAQNAPMNPNPDVLFLRRTSHADDVCARKHYPGRTWYRAGFNETLRPF